MTTFVMWAIYDRLAENNLDLALVGDAALGPSGA